MFVALPYSPLTHLPGSWFFTHTAELHNTTSQHAYCRRRATTKYRRPRLHSSKKEKSLGVQFHTTTTSLVGGVETEAQLRLRQSMPRFTLQHFCVRADWSVYRHLDNRVEPGSTDRAQVRRAHIQLVCTVSTVPPMSTRHHHMIPYLFKTDHT